MTDDEATSLSEQPNAPLGTFSARIKLGRALGIYGPLLEKKLNKIRNIRNQFAHALVPIDFGNELVAEECESFPLAMMPQWPLPNDWLDTRIRYVTACFGATDYLVGWSMNNGGVEISVDDQP